MAIVNKITVLLDCYSVFFWSLNSYKILVVVINPDFQKWTLKIRELKTVLKLKMKGNSYPNLLLQV